MKRYIHFAVVIVMVLAIVGIARDSSVWAGSSLDVVTPPDLDVYQADNLQVESNTESGTVHPPDPTITIRNSGVYNVGGVCSLTVEYKGPDLYDRVILRKAAGFPFPKEEGQLYLPGCELFHFKSNKLVNETSAGDGSWKICFANLPDKDITIYYLDNFSSKKPAWIALETTVENGQVCAAAYFTGLYAPAGN